MAIIIKHRLLPIDRYYGPNSGIHVLEIAPKKPLELIDCSNCPLNYKNKEMNPDTIDLCCSGLGYPNETKAQLGTSRLTSISTRETFIDTWGKAILNTFVRMTSCLLCYMIQGSKE